MTTITDSRVPCQHEGCEYKSHSLIAHLMEEHGQTAAEYTAQFPGAATVSAEALAEYEGRQSGVTRRAAPQPTDLKQDLMGMMMPVDCHVKEEDCLPLPPGYMFPTKGKAHKIMRRIIMALARGRNVFVWGMPGTGKDAAVHAFSALVRRPTVMVTFRPGTDLAPWFYTRSIGEEGTGWEFGHLWRALTEGVLGRDGKRRAPIVLLSDVDRADSAQAEWFRILTDSMQGRILDPHGKMVPLFVDEWGRKPQFVCTANSCGTGDARGRMASANPMDASILDRLGRKIEAAYLHWDDESTILRAKFPQVAERAPSVFDQLGEATEKLRDSIEKEELYAELTHRGLCEILSECEDILHFAPSLPSNLLKRGFRAWLDGLDTDSFLVAKRLIDPALRGGTMGGVDDNEEY